MFEGKELAESAVAKFRGDFNAEDFESIVATAHPSMLKVTSKDKVLAFLSAVRKKLGKSNDSNSTSWFVNGGPGGTNVTFVYETSFENGTATETFNYIVDDSTAKLFGYHIVSPDFDFQKLMSAN